MNTRFALWFGGIILAVFLADHLFFGAELWVDAGKLLWRISTWLAFWR